VHDVRLPVRLSVILIDSDNIVQQKVEMGTRQIGVLATCMPKPIRIIVFCDSEFC